MNNKFKIALVASLIVNVLLIGYGAAHYTKSKHYSAFSSLTEAQKQNVKAMFKEMRAVNEPLFKQMREEKKAMRKIMMAEIFDKDQYLQQVAKVQRIKQNLRQNMSQIISEKAVSLSQDERTAFVKMMKHKKRHYRCKGK